ncbi:cyclic nucleotide-binding domain-containing protein [Candidatus Poribacteria bacterium]|nr:cyclic nucleotide-binding domain-containing protein [Candidatus Poribacteria bacterium]
MDDLKRLYDESEKLRTLRVSLQPNNVLFSEGDQSLEMYILLSGKVEILKNNRRIAVVEEEGSYLGELSTLLGIPRTATVRTVSLCNFIVVSGERVMDFFTSSPALSLKLARVLAERLVKMNREHVRLEQRIDLLEKGLQEADEKIRARDQQIAQLIARIERIQKLQP